MTERLVVVLCDLVKVVRTDVAKEERKIAEDIYVYLLGVVCAIVFFLWGGNVSSKRQKPRAIYDAYITLIVIILFEDNKHLSYNNRFI